MSLSLSLSPGLGAQLGQRREARAVARSQLGHAGQQPRVAWSFGVIALCLRGCLGLLVPCEGQMTHQGSKGMVIVRPSLGSTPDLKGVKLTKT